MSFSAWSVYVGGDVDAFGTYGDGDGVVSSFVDDVASFVSFSIQRSLLPLASCPIA